eukprot:GILK01006368.1.p1 GENE.GILK01006368.1~~GILK01006368.1.p1  ORF type:complete len:254 (-),score=42.15 GILK01006368.1:200-898(-)
MASLLQSLCLEPLTKCFPFLNTVKKEKTSASYRPVDTSEPAEDWDEEFDDWESPNNHTATKHTHGRDDSDIEMDNRGRKGRQDMQSSHNRDHSKEKEMNSVPRSANVELSNIDRPNSSPTSFQSNATRAASPPAASASAPPQSNFASRKPEPEKKTQDEDDADLFAELGMMPKYSAPKRIGPVNPALASTNPLTSKQDTSKTLSMDNLVASEDLAGGAASGWGDDDDLDLDS